MIFWDTFMCPKDIIGAGEMQKKKYIRKSPSNP